MKTIELFDENGKPLHHPILVEQVFGTFDDVNRLYDTSYLQYKNKIYYFKRLFQNKEGSNLYGVKGEASMNEGLNNSSIETYL